MPEIKCEAVLFDMDGTILDSSIPVQRQWRLWAESVGIPFEQVLAVMHGRRAIETMQIVAPHLPQPRNVNDFLLVEAKDTEGIVEMPGARAMLEALPHNRWAVVTSATYDMARSRMRAAGLPHVDMASRIPKDSSLPPPRSTSRQKTVWWSRIRRRASKQDSPPGCRC